MKNSNAPADGQYVVIQGGQRVSAPTPNQAEAQAEADKRNKLNEGKSAQESRPATVKQNLCG